MARLALGFSTSTRRYFAASSKSHLALSWHSTYTWEGKALRTGPVRGVTFSWHSTQAWEGKVLRTGSVRGAEELRCHLEDLSNILVAFKLGLGRQGPPHGYCAWCRKCQNFQD